MIQYFISLFLISSSLVSFASGLTPLPVSFGALLYDVDFPEGPGSHGTNNPGQWVSDLTAFNANASPVNQLTRLYPYSADIEITCSDPSNINTCTIVPGYITGSASVLAYHNAFTQATILPIVDISFNYLNNSLLKTNTILADNVAQALVTQICNDPNADGVFFDLETSGGLSNPGLFEFYREVSKLFAMKPCADSSHPQGRYMGIYLTPVNNDWSLAQAMFGNNQNSFLAIPLYDVKGFTNPPTPDPLGSYGTYVTSAITHASTYGTQYKVPYTIIVPAAASFGTFQAYGIYNPSEPAPTYFQLITDYSSSNATQLAFVKNPQKILCTHPSPYSMGMDYWGWLQYVNPGKNSDGTYQLVMPNTPDANTTLFLQKCASCSVTDCPVNV